MFYISEAMCSILTILGLTQDRVFYTPDTAPLGCRDIYWEQGGIKEKIVLMSQDAGSRGAAKTG
ncbi:MAG TPA: hypothetical protein DEA71_08640 [Nitrospira sp.]|nr:hypothetical protein [Nitrospira sp.]